MNVMYLYEASANITATDCGGGSLGKVRLCRHRDQSLDFQDPRKSQVVWAAYL